MNNEEQKETHPLSAVIKAFDLKDDHFRHVDEIIQDKIKKVRKTLKENPGKANELLITAFKIQIDKIEQQIKEVGEVDYGKPEEKIGAIVTSHLLDYVEKTLSKNEFWKQENE